MSVVIDTSVTMTWCFEDEATPSTEDILDLVVADGALASPLWTVKGHLELNGGGLET